MSTTSRVALGCLGLVGLALVGMGVLVARDWDAVSKRFRETVATQSEQTQVTLFRLGELMSIGVELKAQYGVEPDMAYESVDGDRVLSISFSDYQLPGTVTAEDHAREIAVFAVGKTKKFEQVDVVEVRFQNPAESYRFALDEIRGSIGEGP